MHCYFLSQDIEAVGVALIFDEERTAPMNIPILNCLLVAIEDIDGVDVDLLGRLDRVVVGFN